MITIPSKAIPAPTKSQTVGRILTKNLLNKNADFKSQHLS